MKTILIVYPHNFFKQDTGINQRFFEYYLYFISRNFKIDILGLKGFDSEWTTNDIESIRKNYTINNLEFGEYQIKKHSKQSLTVRIKKKICGFFGVNNQEIKGLPDFCSESLHDKFNLLIKENKYDYILFGYAYWAKLLNPTFEFNTKTKKILDVSDNLTMQHFVQDKINFETVGKYFGDEIERFSRFDACLYISNQEFDLFSPYLLNKSHYFIPMFTHKKQLKNMIEYDILYIASANPHNQKSIQWFLENVYPILPTNYKILIVGKICTYIEEYKNITKINYVENLDEVYEKSRICICPMLSGTGMKIKTVEALSYSKPIVGTYKAIDGFSSKENNGCLITNDPKIFANNIVKLIEDEEFYAETKKEGELFFNKHFLKENIYNQLDEIFK